MNKLQIGLLTGLAAFSLQAETIRLECERFAERGGWTVDSQFRLEMGSTYLLAHGMGVPVADARTSFDVPAAGRYAVWARTKNWTGKWSDARGAGRFRLLVNGVALPEELGVQGKGEWLWTKAGEVDLAVGANTVALHDLTGFDGRCDALVFTTERTPPASQPSLTSQAPQTLSSDLTVVGGGIAGICTAVSAARLGLKVALVQDRPVLGGANSSEVRVHLGGYVNLSPYPRLGDIVKELGQPDIANAETGDKYMDERKLALVKAEPNVTLCLNTMVEKVEMLPGSEKAVAAVVGFDVVSGKATRFVSPLFADCTGDGTVGYLAGADYRLGREAKAETGEPLAVEKADKMTLGASVQWYAGKMAKGKGEERRAFPHEPWMIAFNESNCEYNMKGDWDWETGMLRDQLDDFETVRDYGLLVVYSNWSFIKNDGARKAEFADAALEWVAYVAGKRETRRLLGDHVLTQQDVFEERPYPDATCCTTWPVDLHFPMPANQRHYEGEPFRSVCTHDLHAAYPIPYRCFYSRNVANLFMAGRDISVTHVALGTTRVMRTHGMMGEVVGMAASVCKARGCRPRGVYADHLDDLKALMARGVGSGRGEIAQDYNLGGILYREGLEAKGLAVDGAKVTDVERRDFKGGFALRYRLPPGTRHVDGEDTVWTLPPDARVWYQPGTPWEGRHCLDYEANYTNSYVRDIPVGMRLALPIVAKTPTGCYRFITEANVVDWTDAAARYCGGGRFAVDYYCETNGFDRSGTDVSPWRVFLNAGTLTDLATNDVVRRLCPPPSPEVAARCRTFVKPGRAIWQWLPSGDPVYAEQKDWYDRTKALGFEYYLVDDGWKKWRDGGMDQWACLAKWIGYGKSIGVGSFVWVDSKEMPDAASRRAYLAKVKATGAVGIKIDFIPEPTCAVSRWYEETLRDTFELGLMTDFHGCVKPTGRERTWPHEVAREGIRGHEWHVTRYRRVLPPEHDAILPFSRLVQGHADYTPVVFEKKELNGYTWARELAQGIVFSAPFLCFGDYPKNYQENPAAELLKALPSVYDEMRVLPGSEIGECVAVAKRKGRDWFVAVENGATARKLEIPLTFLGGGVYAMESFADAADRPDDFVRGRRQVTAADVLSLDVKPCGGFVARFRP